MATTAEQKTVIAQFQDNEGKSVGPPLSLPAETTQEQLDQLINQILNNVPNLGMFPC